MYPSQRRHRQINRPKKMKRQHRGAETMDVTNQPVVKKIWMPWG